MPSESKPQWVREEFEKLVLKNVRGSNPVDFTIGSNGQYDNPNLQEWWLWFSSGAKAHPPATPPQRDPYQNASQLAQVWLEHGWDFAGLPPAILALREEPVAEAPVISGDSWRAGMEEAAKIADELDSGANPEWDGGIKWVAASIRERMKEKS